MGCSNSNNPPVHGEKSPNILLLAATPILGYSTGSAVPFFGSIHFQNGIPCGGAIKRGHVRGEQATVMLPLSNPHSIAPVGLNLWKPVSYRAAPWRRLPAAPC